MEVDKDQDRLAPAVRGRLGEDEMGMRQSRVSARRARPAALAALMAIALVGIDVQVSSAAIVSFADYDSLTASSKLTAIAAGHDGNLWFTETSSNKVGRIDAFTHAVNEYTIPTVDSQPLGIAAGPDDRLWFAESNKSKLGRATTAGGITEIPLTSASPTDVTEGSDGNMWASDAAENRVVRINSSSLAVTYFSPGFYSVPGAITPGRDGNLWIVEPI